MNKIIEFGVVSKDEKRSHKIEIEILFSEPVTGREAEKIVADAIGKFLFNYEKPQENEHDI